MRATSFDLTCEDLIAQIKTEQSCGDILNAQYHASILQLKLNTIQNESSTGK